MTNSLSPKGFATTSWDDGAVEDLRLADLLAKYDIPACFYIPRENPERPVIGTDRIRELSQRFEIGGHTLSHVRLTSLPIARAKREIHDCKPWLEDVTGETVRSFCYPGGMFSAAHAREVARAGFTVGRTADWMCLQPAGLPFEIAPSLHLYPHAPVVHIAHCIRRRHFRALADYVTRFRCAQRPARLAELMLKDVAERGGVFHLWGHSWEVAERNLWGDLEEILRVMSELRGTITHIDNGELAVHSVC